jgi:hypothetical protein
MFGQKRPVEITDPVRGSVNGKAKLQIKDKIGGNVMLVIIWQNWRFPGLCVVGDRGPI